MKTTGFGDVEPFTMVDLQNAVQHLPRNICVHSKDIVAICSVYEVVSCMNTYFMYDNLMLVDGHVERTCKQTCFSMIPISSDYDNPRNWRPLGFLNIIYHIAFVCVKFTA